MVEKSMQGTEHWGEFLNISKEIYNAFCLCDPKTSTWEILCKDRELFNAFEYWEHIRRGCKLL